MYQEYKPLRNFLRGYNLWSSLGTTYCYSSYLKFDRPLPDKLKNGPLRFGQSNIAAGLHGHLVEILIRELVLNADSRGGKSFDNATCAFKAMQMIHRLDDHTWGIHGSRSDDILLQISRIAFKQFTWQDNVTNGLLSRYYELYGHDLVAPMVEAEFGLTSIELFQIILLFIEELTRRPTLSFSFLVEAQNSVREPVFALRNRLARAASELRSLVAERQSYDVNWAYTFNVIREFPLVHSGNPQSVMCPAPPILVQRLTDGLYFDLIRGNKHFGNAIGTAFEEYVGKAAAEIGGDALQLSREVRWGKPEKSSVDWIIQDKSGALFIECKFGRLDIASQTELSSEPPFLVALQRLAGNVGQLYATLNDALCGEYPHWTADSRSIYPLVVTFHEWFAFGPFFYRHLDSLVAGELEKRGLDQSLLDRYPYNVCSISEMEGLLTAAAQHSIDVVLSKKNSAAHRQSLLRGVLAELYPGSLKNAIGTFESGMDEVVNGPSRLTRP